MFRKFMLLAGVVGMISAAGATILQVPQQYLTIQQAVNAASSGDTIEVSSGYYYESVNFQSKNLVMLGIGLPHVQYSSGPCFYITSGQSSATYVKGFEFQCGWDGAIYSINSFPLIEECNFTSCFIAVSGGGTVQYCTFYNCTTCGVPSNSGLTFRCNLVTNCGQGGHNAGGSMYFANNTIANGGIGIEVNAPLTTTIENNIFYGLGYAIYNNSQYYTPAIGYNCYNQNGSNFYWCSSGGGDIFVDPLFVGGSPLDYHLTQNSPCIDAGNPSLTDPDGTRSDMGCYFYPQPNLVTSADSIEFSEVFVDSTAISFLTLCNVGTMNLIIFQVSIPDSHFATNFSLGDSLILPGDSLELMVTFAPDSVGQFSGLMSIISNGIDAEIILEGEGIPLVAIELDPLFEPVFIYPWGGEVGYYLILQNNTGSQQTFDVWVDVLMPDSSIYGPVIQRNDITFAPSYHLSRLIVQSIPAAAPSGRYFMRGHVGDYQTQDIWSEDSFPFTKVDYNNGLNGQPVAGWSVSGWDDEIGMTNEILPSFRQGADLTTFLLHPCVPNPFNPTTVANYELPVASFVRLHVYDTAGRLVATLVDGWREAGAHEVTFDGSGLAAGIYFARLRAKPSLTGEAGEYVGVQKMVLLK